MTTPSYGKPCRTHRPNSRKAKLRTIASAKVAKGSLNSERETWFCTDLQIKLQMELTGVCLCRGACLQAGGVSEGERCSGSRCPAEASRGGATTAAPQVCLDSETRIHQLMKVMNHNLLSRHPPLLSLRVAQGPVLEPPAVNTSPPSQRGLTRRALDQHQDQQVSAGHGSDAVSLYLKSLDQKGPGSPPCKGPRQSADQDLSLCVSVDHSIWREGEDGETKLAQREDVRSALPVAMSQKGGGAPAEAFTTGHQSLDGLLKAFNQSKELPSRLNQSNVLFPGGLVLFPGCRQGLGTGTASELESSLLSSDGRSLRSDSSGLTSSTFDTRDEQEFRDGLAALDASIASLQKTIQLDLKK